MPLDSCSRGLDFAVYTFPVISLAIIGLVYLNLLSKEPLRRRKARSSTTGFSNPVIVNSFVGVLSCIEILDVEMAENRDILSWEIALVTD
ncbi:hypothetical protein GH714_040649 [Hevea brasiliensis]|uniref:Uncharacterized protein n=1 Tax=Hevea brasiliensis TaxID=3981 RepID=A0A6A6KYT2_HEVBR|nr:hypothetical protein GH714_040649 [Hevea brasiliensis]